MKSTPFLIAFLLFTNLQTLHAQPQKTTSVEGITEYNLDNGLKVLLFPDPSKQTITVNVTYLVGSKHENYGETGMAHLLEHLLFKGTEKHPELTDELSKKSPRANGTTWYDRTNYYETLTASEENLEWAIEMEADRMVNSRVSQEDLNSEMTVVRNEFELGENNPYGVLIDRVMSTAFLWHNYGKSTIGARSDIENVPIDRLQAFYRKFYQPDNAVLIIAGNFDENIALGFIDQYFGAIPRPERKLPQIYTQDPIQDGEREVSLRRVGATQLAGVAYHIPSGSHEDYAAIDIIVHTLGNTPSGRIYKNMVDSKIATRVFGFNFQLEEPGVALFAAEALKEISMEDVRSNLLNTIEEIRSKPPTEAEIERARQSKLKDIEQAFNSSERISIMLSEWIGMGDWRLFFLHRDRIESVDAAAVAKAADKYFKRDNRTVGIFIPTEEPDRTEIPGRPDVSALVMDYKGKKEVSMGETFDPSVENIMNRSEQFQLSNGMKVILVPKKTRGESIRMSMSLLHGDEESLSGKGQVASLTVGMMGRGSENMTREQIQDSLNKLKSTFNLMGDHYWVVGSVETDRKNFKKALNVIAEVLIKPTFSESEFESLVRERIANIELQRSEPNAIANLALQKHLNPYPKGDIRYVATFDEQIEDLNNASIQDIEDFYSEFYGASNGIISIVGDIDADETKSVLEDLFGQWKSEVEYSHPSRQIQATEILSKRIKTPDKKNAFFFGSQEFPFTADDPDLPAIELGYYLLGYGFQSRLLSRLREKEGLSYGAGGRLSVHPIQKIGSVRYYAIYAPENADKLEEAFKDEIRKVMTDGYTETEVEEAKKSWLENRVVNVRSQDNALARHLGLYTEWGRSLQWDAQLEEKVASLTVEEVNAAMKKHLDVEKIHMVMAGDFKSN